MSRSRNSNISEILARSTRLAAELLALVDVHDERVVALFYDVMLHDTKKIRDNDL